MHNVPEWPDTLLKNLAADGGGAVSSLQWGPGAKPQKILAI